jgi:VanZ family protein
MALQGDHRGRHRSSAVLLALAFVALVVYASLYPFTGWRWPPGQPLEVLVRLPWPRWRLPFDDWSNFVGYIPLGALIYVGGVRSGARPWVMWLVAAGAPAALSYLMEFTQNFLPGRYPSLLDLVLNASGAGLGAVCGLALQGSGWIERWQSARERWFIDRSAGALALLVLWPVALLFPAPLPLGLGPPWDRVQASILSLLADVPWAAGAYALLDASPPSASRLVPLTECIGVALGLLGPCLLAFAVTRPGWRRLVLAGGIAAAGFASTTLSSALNFGPAHALGWVTPAVEPGFALALLVAATLSLSGQRLAGALGIAVLSGSLMLVAQAPSDPYVVDSLQAWEQGRFIRFHGLAQWFGWLWPMAVVGWLCTHVAGRWR